jgi:glucan biosynthesis protein C
LRERIDEAAATPTLRRPVFASGMGAPNANTIQPPFYPSLFRNQANRVHVVSGSSELNGCHVSARPNIPLSNLRAVVILIVVAFHSVLSYLASQPAAPFPFDAPPYRWIAFPIIDRERWFGFDLFCAWQDVSLMSLMFFLAGLFTPASLSRKGSLTYLSERCWRIGLPFLFAAGVLSPAAFFASYRTTATDPSVTAFWQHWMALPTWPEGPAWFLWQLLFLSALGAALHALASQRVQALGRLAGSFSERPLSFCIGLIALSVLAYVPLAMIFTPWDWASLGPFSLQLSRPLHYTVYFFAAFAIGGYGIDRGVLGADGPLARHWLALLAAAVASLAVWGGLTSLTLPDWNASPLTFRLAAALAFPVACATGALSLLAICLRLMRSRHRALDSLSTHAYSIYLLHYVFVVWLQYALVGVGLDAIEKAAIVFVGALTPSWAVSAGLTKFAALFSDLTGKPAIADQLR